jgi:transposase
MTAASFRRARHHRLHPAEEQPQAADRLRQGAPPPAPPLEIAFARRKDWRRIVTRYDRRATIFFGATTLAAIIIFRLVE